MELKHSFTAIIPARKNSKRLPGKNMLLLDNRPLIDFSVKYALRHKDILDKIIITTDDEKILDFYKTHRNILLHKRPPELAEDDTPTIDAVRECVLNVPVESDYIVLLQPTNPLRPANLLVKAIEIIERTKQDNLMTVSPLKKKLGRIEDNRFMPYNYTPGQRSQDMEPLFYENGLLYITKREDILAGKIITEDVYPLIVEHPFGTVDIDTKEDFEYALFLLKKYDEKSSF